jgi:aspartate racemase
MKTIGLLGGMSWESTVEYYRLINRGVQARLGGLHSAKIVLASVDFHEIAEAQRTERWEEAGALLARHARGLQQAGADFLVICANTMHKVAPLVTADLEIPLLHIGDVTADSVAQAGCRRPALLGTRFTMEQPFYRDRLAARQSLEVIVPTEEERTTIHRIIYEELCRGEVRPVSRDCFRKIIDRLTVAGADGVIFGCTEIPLLVSQADSPVPVFDTTALHAAAAVDQVFNS